MNYNQFEIDIIFNLYWFKITKKRGFLYYKQFKPDLYRKDRPH